MKTRLLPLNALAAWAAVLALASCGSPAATSPPAPDSPSVAPPSTSTNPPPTPTTMPPTRMPAATATAPGAYALLTDLGQITGTYQFSGLQFVRFDQDGTFRSAHALDDLEADPYQVSSCRLEEGRLVIQEISVSGVPTCGSRVGSYEVRLLDNGDLQVVLIKDGCTPRAADTAGVYSRLP
jgi:hypothetical protein